MIETRYKVVNKYLREIRDIDVKESSVKGSSGSFGVTTPLHCKVGEYLNTNVTFHDNTFEKSLHSGLLRTYLQHGDIVQVYYDTVAKKEVDSPYGNPQPIEYQPNDQVIAMAKVFNDAGITADDIKDLVGLLKEKKAQKEEPKNQKINTIPKIVVDKPVDKQNLDNPKNIEKSNQSGVAEQSVDNSKTVVDNLQPEIDVEAQKTVFKEKTYQQKLKYIKEQCNDPIMLKWIQENFKQVAIFNAASKKIQLLETPKTEI